MHKVRLILVLSIGMLFCAWGVSYAQRNPAGGATFDNESFGFKVHEHPRTMLDEFTLIPLGMFFGGMMIVTATVWKISQAKSLFERNTEELRTSVTMGISSMQVELMHLKELLGKELSTLQADMDSLCRRMDELSSRLTTVEGKNAVLQEIVRKDVRNGKD